MRMNCLRLVSVLAVSVGAGVAIADPGGAPAARTGAPAVGGKPVEGTCTGCHGGSALNTGGSVQILDAPALYRQGRTYRLRVRLTSSQTAGSASRLWAFQITAVNTSDGTGTGTFATVPGQSTSTTAGSGNFSTRRYPQETGAGMQDGRSGPVEWLVDWTAPSATVPVTFYATGMAANGNGGTSGDWVYTTSVAAADSTTPAATTSWGMVKGLYRR